MYLRRVGGAYGMKISRSIQSAVACSLVCQKLNRPCRFIQPLTTNMQAVGKRLPFSNDYEVCYLVFCHHETYMNILLVCPPTKIYFYLLHILTTQT